MNGNHLEYLRSIAFTILRIVQIIVERLSEVFPHTDSEDLRQVCVQDAANILLSNDVR